MLEEFIAQFFWTDQRWIELAGAVTSITYVVLALRRSIWCWPFGIVGAVLYVHVLWGIAYYAAAFEYGLYFFLCIYGWVTWGRGDQQGHELPVRGLGGREALRLAAIGVGVYLLAGFLLWKYTDANLPFRDSLTTSFSLIAQWMTAKKIIENWLVWIVVNVIYLTMFAWGHLWYLFGYYVFLLVLAVFGYLAWRRAMRAQDDPNAEIAEPAE